MREVVVWTRKSGQTLEVVFSGAGMGRKKELQEEFLIKCIIIWLSK